ncbi:type IV toxin-antitoxin system AbiEi family antitoxin domain-containing protein [Austwickia chelonae]|uniref:type IV toxin-antitoxin system AbiEi family antitoxin domain-containing protein n=1 Tax=Austwickia chelonae TaxID=100225 RepID=UPI000E227E47|nr:type IV toxin-antitoxin system AbiEi family antitoxin domain-containing protein [Austwickia chelonae]
MHAAHRLSPEAAALARTQNGVLSVPQLHTLGFTRRSINRISQQWTRIERGIYLLVPHADVIPWEAKVWAGVLLGGPGAHVGGPTAAILHGLITDEDLRRQRAAAPSLLLKAREAVHVFVPRRKLLDRGDFTFQEVTPGERETPSPAHPPRTGITDTVLDLCALGDVDETATWVSRACQRRLSTPEEILRRLEARPRLKHADVIRAIAQDADQGVTTELERRGRRDVIRAHGLPTGIWQMEVFTGTIADLAYPEHRILVEFDGRIGHQEEGAFRDRRRDNGNLLRGWTTLRFGWWEVTGDPCGCARQLFRVLQARGWPGRTTPCRRCLVAPSVR